jgi:hypothetical protein
MLDKIEQLPNGDARISFNNNLIFRNWTHTDQVPTTKLLSFTVPKEFALRVCRYIVENSFGYGNQINITFVKLSDGKERMNIFNPKNKTEIQLSPDMYTNK